MPGVDVDLRDISGIIEPRLSYMVRKVTHRQKLCAIAPEPQALRKIFSQVLRRMLVRR
jgi:hypothetical protein